MALTREQLLMLDTLIYANNPNGDSYVTNGASVEDIIGMIERDGYNASGAEMSPSEWEGLIENIREDPTLMDYEVTQFKNDASGMRAACFVDDTSNPTDVNVVFRGTSGAYEWRDNGQGGYSTDTEQQQAALDYVNGLPDKYGNSITVSGHSKGGNKAQYVTILAEPDRISRCISFDGQGFSEEFINRYKGEIDARADRIESISANKDFVNCLLFSIAGIKTYVLTEEQDNPLHYHKPYILFDENGGLPSPGSGEPSKLSAFINEYTTYIIVNVPEPERSECLDAAMDIVIELQDIEDDAITWETVKDVLPAVEYLDNFVFDYFSRQIFGPKGGVRLTRDFSDASKQKMLGLVTQVESEKWGDFTDWVGDRWYDFESWIGTLNIRHYLNNVNAYHKKVIDKNNATEKKINEIFKAVHGVDDSYATTFSNLATNLSEWRRFVDTLSEIVTPGKGRFNGEYISGRLNEVLQEISAANVQSIRDTLVQDVNGEPLFDEELLLEYIKKNPGQMTDDEKQAVLGVIEELQETVAFYESAATIGGDQLGAAFWNRAAWVSETNKFASFSAVSAHYNEMYVNILDGIIEQGEDSNTFAAALLKIGNGENALSLYGLEGYQDVSKIFGSSSIAAYAAKWKTEHSESYFEKLEVSEKRSAAVLNNVKEVDDIKKAGNQWLEDEGLRKDERITKYFDKDGNEISEEEAGFYDRDYTIFELDATASTSKSFYEGKTDVGENGEINVVVGNAEAHAGISAGLYAIGADGKKQFRPGVNAEVGASVTALEADWEQQWLGDENLGLNTEVGVTVGKVGGKGEANFQLYDENGKVDIQTNLEAKVEAIAVEAEGSVGVNVLGGEIEATAGVNVGIGAHAEVGYKDGKFKVDVGASLGIGVSVDVEIDVGGMVDTVVDGAQAAWDGIKKGWDKLWDW